MKTKFIPGLPTVYPHVIVYDGAGTVVRKFTNKTVDGVIKTLRATPGATVLGGTTKTAFEAAVAEKAAGELFVVGTDALNRAGIAFAELLDVHYAQYA